MSDAPEEPADVVDVSLRTLDQLGLSPPVRDALRDIQAEVADAYRDRFIEMMDTLRKQASALERIQATLNILVTHIAPQLNTTTIPTAIGIAKDNERPDLATALVVADPIGSGYTLSQQDLAKALNLDAPTVSVLTRALKLHEQEDCAVVIRKGEKQLIVNFHPRAVERFGELVAAPPPDIPLDSAQTASLNRARKRFGLAPMPGKTSERSLGSGPPSK